VRIERISPQDWPALRPAWDELLEHASEPSAFLSPDWVLAWWRAFGGGRTPLMMAAWDGPGRLAGLAPLYRTRLRWAGLPGPRSVAVMGDEGVGSEYLGFLVRAGREEAFVRALAAGLTEQWSLLDLRGLRADGALASLVRQSFGSALVHAERHGCSRVRLPADYEAYLASLKQKFRSTLRQRTNKLLRTSAVRLLRTREPEEVGPHLDRFFALHQARWEAEGLPGSFHDARKRAFYREVAAGFLRRGWLRFHHLEVDGLVRASQFGFVHGGVLHSLQEAFDHGFRPPGIGGVGVVLRGLAIRDCIGEGIRAYDFLGGTEEFKTRWGTAVHHTERVRIGAPGWAGRLAFGGTAGVLMAREWARARVPRWAIDARAAWTRRHRPLLELGLPGGEGA
jgi:CelD/BcsL family acetyltransferase involved in cellulose biosynthesis